MSAIPPPGLTPTPTPAPQRNDRLTFSSRFDAFITWIILFVTEVAALAQNVYANTVNAFTQASAADASASAAATSAASAAASAASAIASPSTSGTSSTSLTLGSGNQSLTTQTGKNWAPGMWINCVRTSDRSKSMSGYIDSYNSGTGALVLTVNAANVKGGGTFADWTLTVSGQPGSIFDFVDLSLLGPSIRPSFMNDFANAKRLDSRFTYTMTSPLSYYDAAGILRYAAPGVPAFDHDPVTGKCLGLSMWEARTNLESYSQDLSNAVYSKSGLGTVTTNTAGAPDGTATLNKLQEDSSTGLHTAVRNITISAGATYTMVRRFKAAEKSLVQMLFDDTSTTNGIYANFDISNGTVVKTLTAFGSAVAVNAGIVAVGGGIYEAWVTGTAGLSTTSARCATTLINTSAAGPFPSYSGVTGQGIYVWGCDTQAGTFKTPYIPTTSTTVTRNAPTLTMPTSAFEFNAAEGTMYVEGDYAQIASNNPTLARLDDGTENNRIMLRIASGTQRFSAVTGGVGDVDISLGAPTANVPIRVAGAYKANDFAASKDGAAVGTDAAGAIPAVTTLRIGQDGSAFNTANGHISKFAYYPKRLPNSELVALSTL